MDFISHTFHEYILVKRKALARSMWRDCIFNVRVPSLWTLKCRENSDPRNCWECRLGLLANQCPVQLGSIMSPSYSHKRCGWGTLSEVTLADTMLEPMADTVVHCSELTLWTTQVSTEVFISDCNDLTVYLHFQCRGRQEGDLCRFIAFPFYPQLYWDIFDFSSEFYTFICFPVTN